MLERPGPAKDSLLRVWALPAPRAPGPAPRGPRLSGAAVEGPERGRQRGTSCEVNAQVDERVSGTDSKRVRVCPAADQAALRVSEEKKVLE